MAQLPDDPAVVDLFRPKLAGQLPNSLPIATLEDYKKANRRNKELLSKPFFAHLSQETRTRLETALDTEIELIDRYLCSLQAKRQPGELLERAARSIAHHKDFISLFLKNFDNVDPTSDVVKKTLSSEVRAELQAYAEPLPYNFTVFIVGTTRTGKSTLVNRLMLSESSQVAEVPATPGDSCTARSVELIYGEQRQAFLRADENTEYVQLDGQYSAVNGWPNSVKNEIHITDAAKRKTVRGCVRLAVPHLLLKAGLRVVDTPGREENGHLDGIVASMVSRRSTVIFLVKRDLNDNSALRSDELATLQMLKSTRATVMILVNVVVPKGMTPQQENDRMTETRSIMLGHLLQKGHCPEFANEQYATTNFHVCDLNDRRSEAWDHFGSCLEQVVSNQALADFAQQFAKLEHSLHMSLSLHFSDVFFTQGHEGLNFARQLEEETYTKVKVEIETRKAAFREHFREQLKLRECREQLYKLAEQVRHPKDGVELSGAELARAVQELVVEFSAIITDHFHITKRLAECADSANAIWSQELVGKLREASPRLEEVLNKELMRLLVASNASPRFSYGKRHGEWSDSATAFAHIAGSGSILIGGGIISFMVGWGVDTAVVAFGAPAGLFVGAGLLSGTALCVGLILFNNYVSEKSRNASATITSVQKREIMKRLLDETANSRESSGFDEGFVTLLSAFAEQHKSTMARLQDLQKRISEGVDQLRPFVPRLQELEIIMATYLGWARNGPVRIGKEIGAGAFGTVYECKWGKFENVVVKRISAGGRNKELLDMCNELHILRRLTDIDGFVQLHGLCIDELGTKKLTEVYNRPNLDGYPQQPRDEAIKLGLPQPEVVLSVVMERYECSLEKACKSLSCDVKLDVVRQLIAAMKTLHSFGFVHRDLKLDNVLINRDADGGVQVFICDFGRANPTSIVTTRKAGAPLTWAPEMVDPEKKEYTKKVDVWAFGMLVWQLFNDGAVPGNFHEAWQAGEQIFTDKLKNPKFRPELDGRIPAFLQPMLVAMWHASADIRPPFDELEKEFARKIKTRT